MFSVKHPWQGVALIPLNEGMQGTQILMNSNMPSHTVQYKNSNPLPLKNTYSSCVQLFKSGGWLGKHVADRCISAGTSSNPSTEILNPHSSASKRWHTQTEDKQKLFFIHISNHKLIPGKKRREIFLRVDLQSQRKKLGWSKERQKWAQSEHEWFEPDKTADGTDR